MLAAHTWTASKTMFCQTQACQQQVLSRRPAPAGTLAPQPQWQAQREDMRALLAQKRNIFLVMMAMDTKRQEIAKLKQHTQQRGTALIKGEQMLSEDTARVDTFLKETDEKLRLAMQEADNEVKAKQEKVGARIGQHSPQHRSVSPGCPCQHLSRALMAVQLSCTCTTRHVMQVVDPAFALVDSHISCGVH